MKLINPGFYIVMLLSVCIITVVSCKKGDTSPTPAQIDSLKQALPTQITHNFYEDGTPSSLTTVVISIKYDTLNSKIELYLDDTTNTNPYDVLGATYIYNSSGYLISYTENDVFVGAGTAPEYDYVINRAADNKINFIVSSSMVNNEVDSTFYTYQAAGSGTNIITQFRHYVNGNLVGSGTVTYNFDADFKATKIQYSGGGSFTYTYNTNGSVSKILAENVSNATIDENYTYASGIPDGKADVFLQTLLGKDYYLPDLQYLNPFYLSVEYDYELNPLSITDPYHVSSAIYNSTSGGQPQTNSATWMYELNDQNNVSEINFVVDGEPESYSFKY